VYCSFGGITPSSGGAGEKYGCEEGRWEVYNAVQVFIMSSIEECGRSARVRLCEGEKVIT